MADGKPVAYLIGTPAFCQTGVCGPILDLLLEPTTDFGDEMTLVHAEVYADDTLTDDGAGGCRPTNMTFEPCCSSPTPTGTLVERLDAVFDKSEMRRRPRTGARGSAERQAASAPDRRTGQLKDWTAAAGAAGVRVVDREPGLLEAVLVVERGALEQLGARRIDDDLARRRS